MALVAMQNQADSLQMDLRKDLSDTFQEWMRVKGFTHSAAACALGVNRSTFSTWVCRYEEKRASVFEMIRIIKKYHIVDTIKEASNT